MICCWVTWNNRLPSLLALDFQEHGLCKEPALCCPCSFCREWGDSGGMWGPATLWARRLEPKWGIPAPGPRGSGCPVTYTAYGSGFVGSAGTASCRRSFTLWIQKIEGKGAWVFHALGSCNYRFGFLAAFNALEEPGPDGQSLLVPTRNSFNAFS